MFSFSFIYRPFLISFFISLLTHWLFRSTLFSLHMFVLFSFFFLWKKKQFSYCFNSFKQFHTVVIRKVLNWVNFSVILCFISTLFIFAGVQSLSHVQLFVTPWTAACQASLSFTISQILLRLMSIESMMPSNHLVLCCPLVLLSSIFPSIRVFSNELAYLHLALKSRLRTNRT